MSTAGLTSCRVVDDASIRGGTAERGEAHPDVGLQGLRQSTAARRERPVDVVHGLQPVTVGSSNELKWIETRASARARFAHRTRARRSSWLAAVVSEPSRSSPSSMVLPRSSVERESTGVIPRCRNRSAVATATGNVSSFSVTVRPSAVVPSEPGSGPPWPASTMTVARGGPVPAGSAMHPPSLNEPRSSATGAGAAADTSPAPGTAGDPGERSVTSGFAVRTAATSAPPTAAARPPRRPRARCGRRPT